MFGQAEEVSRFFSQKVLYSHHISYILLVAGMNTKVNKDIDSVLRGDL